MIGSDFFFVMAAIIGYEYTGIEDSRVFLVYSMLLFAANAILLLKSVAVVGGKLSSKEFLVILIVGAIFMSYLTSIMFSGRMNALATGYFMKFLAFSLPAMFGALYSLRMRTLSEITKLLEIVMLLLTLSVIIKVLLPFFQGRRLLSFAGAGYHQSASYLAAFAFGLNLYFLMNGQHHERLSPFRTSFYRSVCLLLLLVQVLGFALPGGRGGFVLGVAYFLFIVFSQITRGRLIILFRVLLLVVFLATVIGIIWPLLMQNDLFVRGFSRATQFISTSGRINWAGTSGRDVIYQNALHLIKESPVIGYGIFGMFGIISNYPHNLLLEILLQGGVIFLVVAVCIFLLFTRKLQYMKRQDKSNGILAVLFLYPIVMLMFSGTYLKTPQFWFVLVFVLGFRFRKPCS